MRLDRQIVVRCLKVVAVYMLVLAILAAAWVVSVGPASPLESRVLVALWQATGPYAFWIHPTDNFASVVVLPFGIIWLIWLGIVIATPLRNWPLTVHGIMCASWLAAGFGRTMLLIT